MPGSTPERSDPCARHDHDRCPHWVGVGVRGLWRGRPQQVVVLCADACHRTRRCPLTGHGAVALTTWREQCTCPGAELTRRSFERSAERRQQLAALIGDVDLSDRPNAELIEDRLRASAQTRGLPTLRHLGAISRVVAASSGPRSTRTVRLIDLGVRSLAHAVRRGGRRGAGDQPSPRRLLAGAGTALAIAAMVTPGVARSSGWRRPAWALVAAAAWLWAGQVLTIDVVVLTVARAAGRRLTRAAGQPVARRPLSGTMGG